MLKNLGLKMISLFISVLLWWGLARDQPIEIPITVPAGVSSCSCNLVISSDYPFQVQVTLQGPERLLQSLGPSEVHAVHRSAGCRTGRAHLRSPDQDIHVFRATSEWCRLCPRSFISTSIAARATVRSASAGDWHTC